MPDSPINNDPVYTISNNYGKSLSHLKNRRGRRNTYYSNPILASEDNSEEIYYHDNNDDHENEYHGGDYGNNDDHKDDHDDHKDDYSKIANNGDDPTSVYSDVKKDVNYSSILSNHNVMIMLLLLIALFVYVFVFKGEIKFPKFNFGHGGSNGFNLSDTF